MHDSCFHSVRQPNRVLTVMDFTLLVIFTVLVMIAVLIQEHHTLENSKKEDLNSGYDEDKGY